MNECKVQEDDPETKLFLPSSKRLSLQKMSASDMTSLGTPALSYLHLTVRCKAMGKKVMSSGKLCLKMAISKEFL